MKGFFSVAALAAVLLVASSHHLDLCDKDDQELRDQLQCQRNQATAEFKRKFDRVNRQLQCDSDLCSIRKMCAEPDFLTALKRFFTEGEIEELHELANQCDAAAQHSHGQDPH
ncbi:antimicrobial peptide microplusin-like [Ornithodoros turicata]|uniref:antimicrobial peptide microplusin-like n=1 Tax=Ornithodoros turicata TaxID=34597 RepID=UPI003138B852